MTRCWPPGGRCGGARSSSRAAELLEGSLNYEEMLVRVARIAVPEVADWCPVDLLDDAGPIRRLAAHASPAKERFAR